MKMILSFLKNCIFNYSHTKSVYQAQLMQQRGRSLTAVQTVADSAVAEKSDVAGELEKYFDIEDHRLLWKWRHYFDIYEQHLSKFKNKSINLLEIGVYQGGSLQMWRHYFGEDCNIIGVDIDQECQRLESENTSILIGDQTDRSFWQKVKEHQPPIDILIDDGGHKPNQQIITFESMLTHIKPGGVYLCEDVHRSDNQFLDYMFGLSQSLNNYPLAISDEVATNSVQKRIASIHFYPYVVIVEINDNPVDQFISERKGN